MGNINDVQAQIEKKPKDAELLYAARNGDEDKLKALLQDSSLQVDYANSSGLTPLFLAAKEGYAECVRVLLEAGAKVDGIGEGRSVLTPIWVATYAGHGECVGHLINAGANLNAKYPETPLYIAAREGRWPKCLKLLIAAGSDLDVRNSQGQTPLHAACTELHATCVAMLVSAGSDVNAKDRLGRTAMYLACSNAYDGHPILSVLVCRGASVNQPCHQGLSPLHICAQRGKLKNITLLLKHGGNVHKRDKSGHIPRDKAVNHPECEQLLKQHEGLVSSLMKQCRWKIRDLLGPKRLQSISMLPIPRTLHRFLI